jgi:hypothetical protein
MTDPIKNFHDHLDECPQCMNNPFDLCKKGSELLKKTMNKDLKPKFQKLINENFWDLI